MKKLIILLFVLCSCMKTYEQMLKENPIHWKTEIEFTEMYIDGDRNIVETDFILHSSDPDIGENYDIDLHFINYDLVTCWDYGHKVFEIDLMRDRQHGENSYRAINFNLPNINNYERIEATCRGLESSL